MRFGFRRPSIKRRIAARTSWKRYVRHNLGLKAPRGAGWLTNPKKAAYNRVYNRSSVSVDRLLTSRSRSRSQARWSGVGLLFWAVIIIGGLNALINDTTTLQRTFIVGSAGFLLVLFVWFKRALAAKEKAEQEAARQARSQELTEKYCAEVAQRIEDQILWQGATPDMVVDMFGPPVEVNEQQLKTKTKTMYKYFQTGKNRFALRVIFDDDSVVKWEDRRL